MNYYSLRNYNPADRVKGEEYNHWVEYSIGMESQDREGVLPVKRFENYPNNPRKNNIEKQDKIKKQCERRRCVLSFVNWYVDKNWQYVIGIN